MLKKRISSKPKAVEGGDVATEDLDDEHHPDKKYLPKLTIYHTELEEVAGFDGLADLFQTFSLYRGKQEDGEVSDENRHSGDFKGAVMMYSIADESSCDNPTLLMPLKLRLPDSGSVDVIVRVYVVRALELTPVDSNGKADPYLVVQLGATTFNDKDNVINNQLNPIFGRMFEFKAKLPLHSQLTVQVYDWDLIGRSDVIGETKIDIENRFLSRHRGTCGLPERYESKGWNAWRDCESPTAILRSLCQKNQLERPVFDVFNSRVTISGFTINVPKNIKQGPDGPQPLTNEDLALYALHRWHTVPDADGSKLVPEHVETRRLTNPDKPGEDQGRIELWVDIFPASANMIPPAVAITPRKAKGYQLRVIIWNTDEVPLVDDSLLSDEKSSDIYVKGWVVGPEDTQSTDIHYRSVTGEGNFNWRFLFNMDYMSAEEKLVIKKKETMLSWEESETKVPPRLNLQVWDADLFSADDFIGSLVLDLTRIPRPARDAKHCDLDLLSGRSNGSRVPMMNLFKAKRMKGWWPFQMTSEESDAPVIAGKVEAELILMTSEEATAQPAGKGREQPDPLDPPKRPETSFNWFMNPFKTLYYFIWRNYKWLIIKLLLLFIVIALLVVFIYNVPGYMAKRMVGV